ncbi:hypothetical protein BDK51DRAFT_45139 [Blyttiomyces helicus]|uniref:Uncharacterized protein n=1 Tax=Blyttiomyces helicus TaxID=388810 RepID=A0A4P9VVI7_9FUNG|nr:hypothetical protein BDK51DRAFT_45139 [Blyttiomyces helicus]|eukprot:RKO83132.1 hypothetical protein BDK51DRAFT_45139 [Blyttiomyces helicus]
MATTYTGPSTRALRKRFVAPGSSLPIPLLFAAGDPAFCRVLKHNSDLDTLPDRIFLLCYDSMKMTEELRAISSEAAGESVRVWNPALMESWAEKALMFKEKRGIKRRAGAVKRAKNQNPLLQQEMQRGVEGRGDEEAGIGSEGRADTRRASEAGVQETVQLKSPSTADSTPSQFETDVLGMLSSLIQQVLWLADRMRKQEECQTDAKEQLVTMEDSLKLSATTTSRSLQAFEKRLERIEENVCHMETRDEKAGGSPNLFVLSTLALASLVLDPRLHMEEGVNVEFDLYSKVENPSAEALRSPVLQMMETLITHSGDFFHGIVISEVSRSPDLASTSALFSRASSEHPLSASVKLLAKIMQLYKQLLVVNTHYRNPSAVVGAILVSRSFDRTSADELGRLVDPLLASVYPALEGLRRQLSSGRFILLGLNKI